MPKEISSAEKPADAPRRPWPLRWIIAAILIYAAIHTAAYLLSAS